MSIEILTDRDTNQSVMFCNTSDIAFGPVFREDEDPHDFLDWVKNNSGYNQAPEDIPNDVIGRLVSRWRKQIEENENEEAGMRASVDDPTAWEGGFDKNN